VTLVFCGSLLETFMFGNIHVLSAMCGALCFGNFEAWVLHAFPKDHVDVKKILDMRRGILPTTPFLSETIISHIQSMTKAW